MVSRTIIIGKYVEFKYCACGCKKTLSMYYIQPDGRVRKDREQRFILGHYAKMEGNKFSTYNVKKKRPNELINCDCGKCGEKLWKYDKWGKEHRFKRGHNAKGIGNPMYGKKNPQFAELCKKQVGENNPNYRNLKEDATKKALHAYVSRYFPKSEHPICMLCDNSPSHDLACITGIYNREFKNWAWFCKSCHMKYDNIVRNFKGKRRGKAKNSITLA